MELPANAVSVLAQPIPVAPPIKEPVIIARSLVVDYYNRRIEDEDEFIGLENTGVSSFTKALQNWKACIWTDIQDGMYFEVTHDGTQGETYLDAYQKVENVVYPDKEL